MDRITEMKAASLENDDGMKKTGVILTAEDGRRAVVELGAVRWLSNDEMWKLMHPTVQMHHAVHFDDKNYFLRSCPFCGGGSFNIRPMGRIWSGMSYSAPSSVEVIHWCDPVVGQPSRSVVRVGRDIESAVESWNQRK